jgi:hypothetical protein
MPKRELERMSAIRSKYLRLKSKPINRNLNSDMNYFKLVYIEATYQPVKVICKLNQLSRASR